MDQLFGVVESQVYEFVLPVKLTLRRFYTIGLQISCLA